MHTRSLNLLNETPRMKKRPIKSAPITTSMITRASGEGSPRLLSQEYSGLKSRLKTTAKKMGFRIGAPRRIPTSTTTVVARTSITRKKEGCRSAVAMASGTPPLPPTGSFKDSFMIQLPSCAWPYARSRASLSPSCVRLAWIYHWSSCACFGPSVGMEPPRAGATTAPFFSGASGAIFSTRWAYAVERGAALTPCNITLRSTVKATTSSIRPRPASRGASATTIRPRTSEASPRGPNQPMNSIERPLSLVPIKEPNLPFAWVSLDEQDNDPIRLWKHIIEALDRVTPDGRFGADTLAGLGIGAINLLETTLPTLINSLAELPQRVALVLDDYHWITKSDCNETVAFLVEHLPQTVHLVISTRSDPPLGLGRLRARGEVNELRTEQLAFSEEEAASLVRERLGLSIGRADIAKLLERTEGWPAGIYLAAFSMKGRDAHAYVTSLRGSSRYIVDLLAEEVLAAASEEERRFMVRTSVLEEMSGSLCDEVLEMEGSGKLLCDLEHSNLLVIPLNDTGGWYRYHHLLADFLSYELKNTHPKLVPVLHGRASAWFEREGQIEMAIEHAAAAGAYERAGQLIARHSFGYVATGQTTTLRGWLDALPEDLVGRTASLALVEAWIRALHGQWEVTERFLALAEDSSHQGNLPDGTPSVEAGVTLVRGFFG